MSLPNISIITITYNSEKTIRDTFESVKKQNYPNLEYIIIDGGSKDSTLQIAKEYQSVITKIISEPDEGISDAMNKGISVANGELIGIIHSDDMLADGALNILAQSWDYSTDVYYGDVMVCYENGEPMHILRGSDDLSQMNYGFCISHPSTFVTREAYKKYGVYDKSLKCCMDYDQFLRMYKNGARFKHINHVLANYRMGGINQKMRKRTIDESCIVSIRYGGNRIIATSIKYRKKLYDLLRPTAYKLGLRNKRVEKIV